jgi:hypothetical protein
MTLTMAPLPETPDELRSFAASLQTELYAKTLHIEKLKMQLAVLRRARFGRSSEKLDSEIEQMELLLGELEEGQAQGRAATVPPGEPSSPASSSQREKTQPVRRTLPEHLPRERVEHEAACTCPACGGTRLTGIGTDEREVLEYVPSHFKVIVHARPKMSCRDCETITQAPLPWLPIERGLPGSGCWRMCLHQNIVTIFPCTVNPSSRPAREWNWNAQPWRAGLGRWRPCLLRSLKPLPPMCETAEHYMPTIAYGFFRNLK